MRFRYHSAVRPAPGEPPALERRSLLGGNTRRDFGFLFDIRVQGLYFGTAPQQFQHFGGIERTAVAAKRFIYRRYHAPIFNGVERPAMLRIVIDRRKIAQFEALGVAI